ncbi:hypothetical protein HTS61_00720 [Escherichia coli]|nr:hypothetical protein [Escherichia coli]
MAHDWGSDIIAVNAVLMTLLTFTAYALDGFAYAVEAHSGQAYGARDGSQLLDVWRAACRQSGDRSVTVFGGLFAGRGNTSLRC